MGAPPAGITYGNVTLAVPSTNSGQAEVPGHSTGVFAG